MDDTEKKECVLSEMVSLKDVEEAMTKATQALEGEVDRLQARITQLEPQEGDEFFSKQNVTEALETAVLPFENELGRLQERFRHLHNLLKPEGCTTLQLATNRRLAVRICRREGWPEQ